MKKSDSPAYYHVCTDGNVLDWMFRDRSDFIAGVNRVGICAVATGVLVFAFVLMDNHVHFVLYGTIQQCKRFITKYKMLTGKWISSRWGNAHYLKHLPSQLILIEDEEQLLETIAYIDRNPIVAGFGLLPGEYPWGSARSIFQGRSVFKGACALSAKSQNEVRQLLGTWADLPGEWKVDADGMILPECFLEVNKVERLFRTPVRYLYHLSKKLEGKIERLSGTKAFIPDKELRPITECLATELFGTSDVRTLDVNSRIALARKLRYDYASTIKQISRMVHLDCDQLGKFI